MKEIVLTRGRVTKVDDSDFEKISQYKWTYSNVGYAIGRVKKTLIYMHIFIMKPKKGLDVDHRDLDGLNNQRENLRICTRQNNLWNARKRTGIYTSKYKGVRFDSNRKKWKSEITVDYKNIHLGRFDIELDAAIAYNIAAQKYFGEFARLNIIK